MPKSDDDLREHRLHLVLLADVGLVSIGIAAIVADRGRRLLGFFLPGVVVDDHVRAGPAKRQRHALADAGACAGDQGLLAGQGLADRAARHDHRRQIRVIHSLGHVTRPRFGLLGLAAARLQQLRDHAGPAGLVRGAEPAPGVAVEVLVEQHVIPEVGSFCSFG